MSNKKWQESDVEKALSLGVKLKFSFTYSEQARKCMVNVITPTDEWCVIHTARGDRKQYSPQTALTFISRCTDDGVICMKTI